MRVGFTSDPPQFIYETDEIKIKKIIKSSSFMRRTYGSGHRARSLAERVFGLIWNKRNSNVAKVTADPYLDTLRRTLRWPAWKRARDLLTRSRKGNRPSNSRGANSELTHLCIPALTMVHKAPSLIISFAGSLGQGFA